VSFVAKSHRLRGPSHFVAKVFAKEDPNGARTPPRS
jgi:hypothetical protein